MPKKKKDEEEFKVSAVDDDALKNDDQLTPGRAVVALLKTDPFFGNVLVNVPRKFSRALPTASVYPAGTRIEMDINPDFWYSLTGPQQLAVFKHEVMHVISRHITRSNGRIHQKWNWATDAAINSRLENLPGDCIFPSKFKDLDTGQPLPNDKAAEWYYSRLPPCTCGGSGEADGTGSDGDKQSGPGDSNQPGDEEGDENGNSGAGGGEHDNDCPYHRKGAVLDDHSGWEDVPNRESIEENVKRIVKQAAEKSRGTMPSWLESHIKELLKPKINWKQQLNIFVRNTMAPVHRRTITKRNRRLPNHYPAVPGKKKEYKLKLVVCIDTSGSISDQLLRQFLSEIDAIADYAEEVTLIECDSEVKQILPWKKKRIPKMKGRGGTTFSPALKAAAEIESDGIIYLTDGHGESHNRVFNPGKKTLWITTGRNPANFGKIVKAEHLEI